MTLAFYGKSRARQRMLLAFGLFAIIAGALAGAAIFNGEIAKAVSFIDDGGANDEPGQKDLTRLSIEDPTAPTLVVTWNWDDLTVSGANTLDACSLFDTDGNGLADFSVCGSVSFDKDGNATTSTFLYICTADSKADRCGGPSQDPTFTSSCISAISNDDPFPTGNLSPQDRKATCTIQLVDLVPEPTAASLLNVCSYPSGEPNSDPSDCVLAEPLQTTRTVRVVKVTDSATHPAGAFGGAFSPGGVLASEQSWSQSLAVDAPSSAPGETNIVGLVAQSITETTIPADWTNIGFYAAVDTAQACPTASTAYAAGPGTVPAGNSNYLVCVMNRYSPPAVPTLNVTKSNSTTGAVPPGTTVNYTITLTITNGPLSNVVVNDVLPTGIGGATNISDGGTYNSGTNTITWNLATAANGEQLTYDAVVSASATAGTKTNTATATHAACANAGSDCDGTSAVTVFIPGQPSITKTLVTGGTSPISVTDPPNVAWVVTVTNPASLPGINRTVVIKDANVVVTAGPTYTGGADCAPNSTNPAFQTALTSASGVTCTMPGSTTVQSTITFTVAPATTPSRTCANQDFNNTATLQVGTEPAINAVGPTITLTGNPALCPSVGYEKTHSGDGSYAAGETFTWTITATVTNGPTTQAYAIWDDIPSQFTVNSVTPSAAISCTAALDPVDCTLNNNAATGAHTIAVNVTVSAGAVCGPVTNTVRAGSSTASVLDTDEVTIINCGSVVIRKDDNAGNPVAGATFRLERYEGETILEALCVTDNAAAPTAACPGVPAATARADENPAAGVTALSGLALGNWRAIETAAPAGYGPDTCGGTRFLGTLTPASPAGEISGAGCGAAAPTTAFHNPLIRVPIQVCKAWRLDAAGELADPGAATFNFTVADSESPNGVGVEVTGVTEDGAAVCRTVNVVPGTVSVDELPATGFVLEGWTLAQGAVPDITPPFSTADPASFTLTTEGCGVTGAFTFLGSALDLVRSIQAVVVPGTGDPLCTITFINHDTNNTLPTGGLRIEKYKDVNGDGDADDAAIGEGLISWDVTIVGPDPSAAGVRSLVGGTATFPGLNTGDVYTITEDLPGGYVVTRVTVDGAVQPLGVTTSATIPNGGTTVVRFYNQPVETLTVHKVAETVHNGITSAAPDDDDGWIITVSSAACGVLVSKATDANGNAFFDNLPQCTDFVVSENPVNAASPGFVPVGASSYTGVRPNEQTLTFLNRRTTQDPPCTNCTQPTPTPVTPTPTATATATPGTPVATPTRTNTPVPTNTPVTQIAGERTPGPGGATSTPVAPSAGNASGLGGGAGLNFLLFVAGLAGLSAGLGLVALGRRNRR